jgi:hypothetical protein
MRSTTLTLIVLAALGLAVTAVSSASIQRRGLVMTPSHCPCNSDLPGGIQGAATDGKLRVRIPDANNGHPQLRLYPAVTLRGHNAIVTVTHLNVPSLELRVAGATRNLGQPLPWTPLRDKGRAWHGLLPTPEFRGIYPVELRIRRGSPILRSELWLLRVFARGTQSRPSFSTPEGVARGWVRTLPLHARLVAMKRWPQPAFDLRDHRRHQRLVIAYTLAGQRAVEDRLGIFVTAVRDGLQGPWRLLEATVAP